MITAVDLLDSKGIFSDPLYKIRKVSPTKSDASSSTQFFSAYVNEHNT